MGRRSATPPANRAAGRGVAIAGEPRAVRQSNRGGANGLSPRRRARGGRFRSGPSHCCATAGWRLRATKAHARPTCSNARSRSGRATPSTISRNARSRRRCSSSARAAHHARRGAQRRVPDGRPSPRGARRHRLVGGVGAAPRAPPRPADRRVVPRGSPGRGDASVRGAAQDVARRGRVGTIAADTRARTARARPGPEPGGDRRRVHDPAAGLDCGDGGVRRPRSGVRTLLQRLAEAVDGNMRFVLVEGAPGIGKSRFLLADRAPLLA